MLHALSQYRNTLFMVLLVALSGAAVVWNVVASTAYFLSHEQPHYLPYILAGTSLVGAFIMRHVHRVRFKFALFAALVTGSLSAIFFVLQYDAFWSVSGRAFVWVGLAMFTHVFIRWLLGDLAVRHLNPSEALVFTSYSATAYEIGALTVLAGNLLIGGTSAHYALLGIAALFGSIAFFVLLAFVPRYTVELYHSRKPKKGAAHLQKLAHFGAVLALVGGIGFLFGYFEMITKYLIQLSFKQHLVAFAVINDTLTRIYIYASLAVLFGSFVTGYLMRRNRISPILFYGLYILTITSFAAAALLYPSLELYFWFYVALIVALRLLYYPATQVIFAHFTERERHRLNATVNFYYWVATNVTLALAVTVLKGVDYARQQELYLYALLAIGVLLLAAIVAYRGQLIRFFYQSISGDNDVRSMKAVEALSYLQPRDFRERMLRILQEDPRKILKKSVIIGLGYAGDNDAIDRTIQEFQSDKEEIQLAVIQTIKHSRSYTHIKFIIDIMLQKYTARTLGVRVSAAKVLGYMYGRKAIPILLLGLEDEDLRVKANIVEVLSWFKDKSLIPIFNAYADSGYNRLKANALMALIAFRSERERAQRELARMLESPEDLHKASALFVIGLHRYMPYLRQVLAIAESGNLVDRAELRRNAAWALVQLDHPLGTSMFTVLFNDLIDGNIKPDFVHHFAQMSHRRRFRIIEHLILHTSDTNRLEALKQKLNDYPHDFLKEVDFIALHME